MKSEIFPQKEEWRNLYGRLSLWVLCVGSCIGLFWWWHLDYTGTIAVGNHEIPRLLDALAFPVWVALLVCAAHFVQYVHTRPLLAKDYFPDRLILEYLARRIMPYFIIVTMVVAGLSGVWTGADVTTVTLVSPLMFAMALILYGIITALLLFKQRSDRWFEKVFPKRS